MTVPDDLAALLLRIEDGLEDDITLASMARDAGYSPFHFHRRFAEQLGETPVKHVERMRLERAAYLVAVTDAPLTEIGLAVGFNSPETFARAFRRRFGRAPSQYRRDAYATLAERKERMRHFRGEGCTLSEVRFVNLPSQALISVRRLGPYSATFLPPFSDNDAYWTTRSLASRIAATVSRQSSHAPERAEMIAAYDKLELALIARPAGERELRRPAGWGGYRLWPQAIEFWQGQPHRFHDRFRYERAVHGAWTVARLWP